MSRVPLDPDHPAVRYRKVCVRDVDEPDLGIEDATTSEVGDLKARGVGDLLSQASEDIEERIELEDHVGETVAEVYADVDIWEYEIVWHVDIPVSQRIRRLLPGGDL